MADIVYPGQVPGGTIGQAYLPANFDLALYKGDFFSLTVTLKNPDESALDLTGYTAAAHIRTTFADELSYDFEATVDGPAGQVHLFLPSTTSSTIPAGNYIWDVEVTQPDGNSKTYLTGDVKVYDEVTRV